VHTHRHVQRPVPPQAWPEGLTPRRLQRGHLAVDWDVWREGSVHYRLELADRTQHICHAQQSGEEGLA
jgi:hypothetical protein